MNKGTTIGMVVIIAAIAIAGYFYLGNSNSDMPVPAPTSTPAPAPTTTPSPTSTPTLTPTSTPALTPTSTPTSTPTPIHTPTPIPLSKAYAIAAEYLETHFPNVLDEGVLTEPYYNSEFKRFCFYWSHKKGILYAETDKAIVWVSDDGEIIKTSIKWLPFEPSLLALTREDCVRVENRVRAVENKSIKVVGYWRIDKVRYFTYKNESLKDWYWIGESRSWNPYVNKTFLDNILIDEDGHIVGRSYPPP